MSTSHSHVTVRDNRPPVRPTVTVGHIFPIMDEPEPETRFSRINTDEDEKSFTGESETKVVRGRRRVAPKATEAAEVK